MGGLASQQENKEKPFRVHFYRWNPSSFHSDPKIRRLSPMERGIYRDLLDMMWLSTDKYRIRDDAFTIPRMVNIKPSQWIKIRAKLQHESAPLFIEEGGYLVSEWLQNEFEDIQETLQKKSEAGKISAEKRAQTRAEQGKLPLIEEGSVAPAVTSPAKETKRLTQWRRSADGRQATIAVGRHSIPQASQNQADASIPAYSSAEHIEEKELDSLVYPPQTQDKSLVRFALRNTLKRFDLETAQKLLDTLSYQLRYKNVPNITGYFGGILRNYHEGNYSPEGAMIVSAERGKEMERQKNRAQKDQQFMDKVREDGAISTEIDIKESGRPLPKKWTAILEKLELRKQGEKIESTSKNEHRHASTA